MNLIQMIRSLRHKIALRKLARSFRQIACGLSDLAESARYAAAQLRELHRAGLLMIRRMYVEAGKPYGNGYAPMMKWWRENYYE